MLKLKQIIGVALLSLFMFHLEAASPEVIDVSGHGQATVIFENGLGDDVSSWQYVVPEVSAFAKVMTYNRLIYSQQVSAQQIVDHLHSLLQKEHLQPPYILVGHSLGGLYLQLFAREYPKEVAGMVLVDSMSPWQTQIDPLPPITASYYAEANGIRLSQKEVLSAPVFPQIPLIMISATKHKLSATQYASSAQEAQWAVWQNQLAALTPNSQHVSINTLHDVQNHAPWLVIAAIKQIITMEAGS
ncbi:MAG: alpha/beta fold hydrolase [Gammaproteobacteria bacterium]|nr:alpha/beta fold hydrolase [Gammaproteobacteria bacterium]